MSSGTPDGQLAGEETLKLSNFRRSLTKLEEDAPTVMEFAFVVTVAVVNDLKSAYSSLWAQLEHG